MKKPQRHSQDLNGIPEPIPEWKEGHLVWTWALPLHCYIFGAVFIGVALYGVYILVKLFRAQVRKSRNYFVCITVLVCVFGLSRAISLLVDPYSTGRPADLTPGGFLLFSLGYPCLTSGFFLINWSLVEVTKLQLLPSPIHKRRVLALILVTHFIVVMTFDSIFLAFPDMHILLFICRSFFVLWGLLLFGGFILAAMRIQRQVKNTLRVIHQVNNITALQCPTITTPGADIIQQKRMEQARTRKVIKITKRAAATGLLICCTQIYALWEFYVFYNNDVIPKAWPWWIYQTCFRCIEVFMVSQMFLVIRPKN